MKALPQIKADNEKPKGPAPKPFKRRCSVSVGKDHVILHSARSRCTKYIDLAHKFKREFLRRTCEKYGAEFDTLTSERWNTIDSDALDKVVESYWGHYPQPDQPSTPGYYEA
jgi:hypothetical protein